MSQSLLLRGARQLLTLRGDICVRRGAQSAHLEVIEDGSVFIQDGKVVSVGTTRRLENLKEARGAIQVPVHNCVVMPGFIDPSIHLSLVAPNNSGKKTVRRRKLNDFFNDSISLLRSCLLHGTLNAAVKTTSGKDNLSADLSVLRQVRRLGNSPIGLTHVWCPDRDGKNATDQHCVSVVFKTAAKRGLVDYVELKPILDKPEVNRFLSAAEQAGMKTTLDWEGGPAHELAASLSHSSPPSVFCRHNLSTSERKEIAKSASVAVFEVGGALLDSEPGGSARELIDEGGAIALGSGYHALNEPNFNMQLVLALAVRRLGLSIEEAIVATTINAAYAMNCGNQIGSLEPGKRAEVLVLNLSDYREIPRRIGVNHVAMAIRDGNIAINRTKWRVGAA